jgi:putative transcriptional regulator
VIERGVVVHAQVAAQPDQGAVQGSFGGSLHEWQCAARPRIVPMGSASRIDLTNQFLIAMPGMADEAFAGTVVYLCEHNDNGALGLVINKPISLTLGHLFEKVELSPPGAELAESPVFYGGPVQTDRGFVLHDPILIEGAEADESAYASTLAIPGGLEMTTSKDVLEAIANGAGPRRVLVTLGYASWGEGQLESELGENAWLTVDADPKVIFDTPVEERYQRALSLLGFDPLMLSQEAGHA